MSCNPAQAQAAQLLSEASSLLAHHWVQGAWAVNLAGETVDPESLDAVYFDAEGALIVTSQRLPDDERRWEAVDEAVEWVTGIASETMGERTSLVRFNDLPRQRAAQMAELFSRAAERIMALYPPTEQKQRARRPKHQGEIER